MKSYLKRNNFLLVRSLLFGIVALILVLPFFGVILTGGGENIARGAISRNSGGENFATKRSLNSDFLYALPYDEGGDILSHSARGTLSQNGDYVSGLDSTWMWGSSNNDYTQWHTAKADERFAGGQTVQFAPRDGWADALAYKSGDGEVNLTNGQLLYRVYNGVLYKLDYWTSAAPGGAGWSVMYGGSKPTASYTFTFQKKSDSEILQYLDSERERIASRQHVFAYMPSWGVYDGHEKFEISNFDFSTITHLTYSFIKPIDMDRNNASFGGNLEYEIPKARQDEDNIDSSSKNFGVRFDDASAALVNGAWMGGNGDLMKQIKQKLAQYDDKYFVCSVGGWSYAEHKEFEIATSTPARLEQFAQSIIDFMVRYDFDGIDIDWEFPYSFDETYEGLTFKPAQQYLDLHKLLRQKLTALSLKTEKYYQLSTATTPNINNIQYLMPDQLVNYVDTVNFMAYDYYGGSFGLDVRTSHNAPLYTPIKGYQTERDKDFNIDAVAKEYVRQGVPKTQLLVGTAFYTRSWVDVPKGDDPKYPGLNQIAGKVPEELSESEGASTGGLWGHGSNPYYRMEQLLAGQVSGRANDYKRYWDEGSLTPYLYSETDRVFHSYDDAESIGIKLDYIEENGYAGAIVWDITGDTRANKGTSEPFLIGKMVGRLVGKPNNGDGTNTNDVTKITTTMISDARAGVAYSSKISAKGQGVKFSLSNSPSWLSIDSSTGNLSGTPNASDVGVAKITVNASSSTTGNDSKNYDILVLSSDAGGGGGGGDGGNGGGNPGGGGGDQGGGGNGGGDQGGGGNGGGNPGGGDGGNPGGGGGSQMIRILNTMLPDAQVGLDYKNIGGSQIIVNGASNVFYRLQGYPNWMSIDASGQLYGTPDKEQVVNITVMATTSDGEYTDMQSYSFDVVPRLGSQGGGGGAFPTTTVVASAGVIALGGGGYFAFKKMSGSKVAGGADGASAGGSRGASDFGDTSDVSSARASRTSRAGSTRASSSSTRASGANSASKTSSSGNRTSGASSRTSRSSSTSRPSASSRSSSSTRPTSSSASRPRPTMPDSIKNRKKK